MDIVESLVRGVISTEDKHLVRLVFAQLASGVVGSRKWNFIALAVILGPDVVTLVVDSKGVHLTGWEDLSLHFVVSVETTEHDVHISIHLDESVSQTSSWGIVTRLDLYPTQWFWHDQRYIIKFFLAN